MTGFCRLGTAELCLAKKNVHISPKFGTAMSVPYDNNAFYLPIYHYISLTLLFNTLKNVA